MRDTKKDVVVNVILPLIEGFWKQVDSMILFLIQINTFDIGPRLLSDTQALLRPPRRRSGVHVSARLDCCCRRFLKILESVVAVVGS